MFVACLSESRSSRRDARLGESSYFSGRIAALRIKIQRVRSTVDIDKGRAPRMFPQRTSPVSGTDIHGTRLSGRRCVRARGRTGLRAYGINFLTTLDGGRGSATDQSQRIVLVVFVFPKPGSPLEYAFFYTTVAPRLRGVNMNRNAAHYNWDRPDV
jgi:hypothetical protein